MICETINFFELSDTVAYFMDTWLIPVLIFFYYMTNFFWTKETDDPPYPFMTWKEEDELSIYAEVFVPFIGFGIHWFWCLVTQYAKPGRLEWE